MIRRSCFIAGLLAVAAGCGDEADGGGAFRGVPCEFEAGSYTERLELLPTGVSAGSAESLTLTWVADPIVGSEAEATLSVVPEPGVLTSVTVPLSYDGADELGYSLLTASFVNPFGSVLAGLTVDVVVEAEAAGCAFPYRAATELPLAAN